MTYDFDLDIHYLKFDNFKQKQVGTFRNVLESGRLSMDMKFAGYAIITVDPEDTHSIHPHIEETENFNRLKTNCLVYDMVQNEVNNGLYHKCFVYQDIGAKGNGWYGYILWNKDTGKTSHVYYIEREEGAFCRRMNKTLLLWRHRDKYLPYNI